MEVLVVQSFGKESEFRRAILCIWSFWLYRPDGVVVLFTDRPSFFDQALSGRKVEYVHLTTEKIREMRGDIDFLHRMKIAIIEETFRLKKCNVLYVDSDTFFIGDPGPYLERLGEDRSFMHLREYRFDSLQNIPLPGGKPFRLFLDLISTSSFFGGDRERIPVTPGHYSWNAGVLILHKTHLNLLPQVYALTDQFYPPTGNHASEQYAFSIVLQNQTQLEGCDDVVYHYWYRIRKLIVDLFLEARITEPWSRLSPDQKLSDIKLWTSTLPHFMESHILLLRDKAIQAFNEDHFMEGYRFTARALLKSPFQWRFIADVLYHTKRLLRVASH